MPRLWSLVMTRARSAASIGATHRLRTPSLGASHDNQRPSGAIWPCARVGLPNSLARGMSGAEAGGAVGMGVIPVGVDRKAMLSRNLRDGVTDRAAASGDRRIPPGAALPGGRIWRVAIQTHPPDGGGRVRNPVATPSQATLRGNNVASSLDRSAAGALQSPRRRLARSAASDLAPAGRCPARRAILQRNKNEKTAAPTHDM